MAGAYLCKPRNVWPLQPSTVDKLQHSEKIWGPSIFLALFSLPGHNCDGSHPFTLQGQCLICDLYRARVCPPWEQRQTLIARLCLLLPYLTASIPTWLLKWRKYLLSALGLDLKSLLESP